MASLIVSGVAPREAAGRVSPSSVLTLFGRDAVPGYWSGLYGSTSTREGIKRLLADATEPQSVFRVVCQVPGAIVTIMSGAQAGELGYLNVRYASADLARQLNDAWTLLSGEPDAEVAMHTRPDLVVDVIRKIRLDSLLIVLHPFWPAQSRQVLTAGTVIDPCAIEAVHSRNKQLVLRFSAGH